jgi:UDP-2,3-diacylglucosamine pyrophosphatase LpxH
MRFTAIFLLTFIFSFSFAGDYKQAVREEISKQFGNAANEESILLDYNHFVVIHGDTFVVPVGYHYVFKVKQGKIKRLDKSTFHGGNFGRYLFTWKNTIYALGGYGFFNTNNNLEYFNAKLEGWAVDKTEGTKPNYILGVAFKLGNKIISFNNFKSGNLIEKDILDSAIYILDLKTKKWSKKALNQNACIQGRVFYTNDFVVSIGEIESILVSRKTLKFTRVKNEALGLDLIHNTLKEVQKNTLTLHSFVNHRKSPLEVKINLETIWKDQPKEHLIVSGISKRGIHISFWAYLVIIGLFSFVVFYFIIRNKSSKLVAEYNELELKLLRENRLLNTEELDELLGIEHMDVDSKKFKRNRMINEMNQRHPDFITRIKDDTDKRRFLYQIKK